MSTANTEDSFLIELGWNSYFKEQFQLLAIPASLPARVIGQGKGSYQVCCRHGELSANISGKMRYRINEEGGYPAVGDWVALKPKPDEQKGIIHAILPRSGKISRKVAGGRERISGGRTDEQVIAANVDIVFIVNGLDGGRSFNLRRIERYLTLAWNSGTSPVIVLNKADICPDTGVYVSSVATVAPDIPVHPVSATRHTGMEALRAYLSGGKTGAFLGPSGVGKSALINALLGAERQDIGEVREDDRRGRHTTTRRELILLPSGGSVIDTPGMRELQVWGEEENLQNTFTDIELLAGGCRFKDCTHSNEPGCAIRAALERGELDPARLESYRKLQKELGYLAVREEQGARQAEKIRWKKIAKLVKEIQKYPNR